MTLSLYQHIRADNFTHLLPGDILDENRPRQVMGAAWSPVTPQVFPGARLLAVSEEMATTLGLTSNELASQEFLNLVSGQTVPPGTTPYAQCYGGHQFGHWAGQLGDGRAINILEVSDADASPWILQLKGAGPTPYSRTADGYAVLRSSVREFLCSEAMFHLGVPTTRALSLVITGESVVRDMFYDGHPEKEPGAIVCRVAPSFLRLGSYEIFTARKDIDLLKKLVDYTLAQHFPHIKETGKEGVCALFREVCKRTALLMVEWARVGFVHGVMNTDNLSILGLTIDYGPYGWLEVYDPNWTPNTTDAEGRRYRFGQQAQVALWNLVQLANALYPLVEDVKPFEDSLEQYRQHYESHYAQMMGRKLGVQNMNEADDKLLASLLQLLPKAETDMTLFFRHLAEVDATADAQTMLSTLRPAFYDTDIPASISSLYTDWLGAWAQRVNNQPHSFTERQAAMNAVNPLYVLRNYLAQQAIDKAAEGDTSGIEELQAVLKKPYTLQPGCEHLAKKRPEWARHRAGCSMLSCSS